jgi:short-subunit dehydrogenase
MTEKGPTALITGASSGLGAAFARQLAARGYGLILVARRVDKLISLAEEMEEIHKVEIEILPADLASNIGIQKIEKRIRALKRLDLLVNSAGYGLVGEFSRQSIEKNLDMLQVHCAAPMRLAHAALPGMIARQSGEIINVASISAFTPMVGNVQYSATKSYLVTFSKALQLENRRHGIKIQALCPGFFHSEFHEVMRANKKAIPAWLFMQADEVARRSLAALKRKNVVYVPGFLYQVAVFLVSLPGLGEPLIGIVARLAGRRRKEFIKVQE